MRFVLFVGIVQSILLFGHWFLYRTLVRFFGLANPSVLLTTRVGGTHSPWPGFPFPIHYLTRLPRLWLWIKKIWRSFSLYLQRGWHLGAPHACRHKAGSRGHHVFAI